MIDISNERMKTIKVKTELPLMDFAILEELARKSGVNMTDTLRNAIRLLDFMKKEEEQGSEFSLYRNGMSQTFRLA